MKLLVAVTTMMMMMLAPPPGAAQLPWAPLEADDAAFPLNGAGTGDGDTSYDDYGAYDYGAGAVDSYGSSRYHGAALPDDDDDAGCMQATFDAGDAGWIAAALGANVTRQTHVECVGLRSARNVSADDDDDVVIASLSISSSERLARLEADDLADLPDLLRLSVEYTALSEVAPGAFARQSRLETLTLSFNSLTGFDAAAPTFAGLRHLRHLDLSNNAIAALHPRAFAGLPALLRLDLKLNRLSAVAADTFADLPALEELHLSNNNISALASGAFRALARLRTLALSDNRLATVPNRALAALPQLRYLELNRNPVTELTRASLRGLRALRQLWLAECRIERVGKRALTGPRALRTLVLAGNRLRRLPFLAGANTALRELDLMANPWQCDCGAAPMLRWLRRNEQVGASARCAAPPDRAGSYLQSHDAGDLCRPPTTTVAAAETAAAETTPSPRVARTRVAMTTVDTTRSSRDRTSHGVASRDETSETTAAAKSTDDLNESKPSTVSVADPTSGIVATAPDSARVPADPTRSIANETPREGARMPAGDPSRDQTAPPTRPGADETSRAPRETSTATTTTRPAARAAVNPSVVACLAGAALVGAALIGAVLLCRRRRARSPGADDLSLVAHPTAKTNNGNGAALPMTDSPDVGDRAKDEEPTAGDDVTQDDVTCPQ